MEGLKKLERKKVIRCYVWLKDIRGASNNHRHLGTHNKITAHLKSRHKLILSTRQLPPLVVVYSPPKGQPTGEGNGAHTGLPVPSPSSQVLCKTGVRLTKGTRTPLTVDPPIVGRKGRDPPLPPPSTGRTIQQETWR